LTRLANPLHTARGMAGGTLDDELRKILSRAVLAHPWHGIPASVEGRDDVVNAYIEIVPTDVVKYELDKASGHLRLDRPQRYSSLCPMPYGFIPLTYCGEGIAARCAERSGQDVIEGDGDPLDVCVLTEKQLAHGGFLAHVRPIGGLRMIDGNQADDKIVAVLDCDVAYGHFQDIGQAPSGVIERLVHYFQSYKQRPDEPLHRVSIAEVYDRAEAFEVIRLSLADYQVKYGSPVSPLEALKHLLGAR
jgi:inorganic pyrophosphatase